MFTLITSLVSQGEGGGGIELIYWILPALCLIITLFQPKGEKASEKDMLVESWYTPQEINEAYSTIADEIDNWRTTEATKAPPTSIVARLLKVFKSKSAKERFVLREEVPPRLYRVHDATGPLFFELTTVEGGGSVVRTMYNYAIKARMARFRASQPAKIPAIPIGLNCPTCGKPVLQEFVVCPYCTEKLIKE
jgi:hypothetical protein